MRLYMKSSKKPSKREESVIYRILNKIFFLNEKNLHGLQLFYLNIKEKNMRH